MDPKLLFYDREQTHFTPLRPQRVAAGQLPLLITIAQGGAMRVVESASGREIWKFTVPDHALIGLNDRHLSVNGHITQNLSLKLNNQYELWFDPQP